MTKIQKIENDLLELKGTVDKIAHVLGVGETPPAAVIKLKERAADIAADFLNNANKKK
jgi:hypothetical protein